MYNAVMTGLHGLRLEKEGRRLAPCWFGGWTSICKAGVGIVESGLCYGVGLGLGLGCLAWDVGTVLALLRSNS